MKRYPAYSNYKDSGIPWVGPIPQHWGKARLKALFAFVKGRNASLYTREFIGENPGGYPVYSGQTADRGVMGKVNRYEYDIPSGIFVTTVGAKAMTPMYIGGKFCLSQNCLLLVSRGQVYDKYYYYYLLPMFHFERANIPDHMQPSLRISDLNRYTVLVPPLREQRAIAQFLDKKTEAVDALIAAKARLDELWAQYRQAVVCRGVTQGFAGGGHLKGSPTEWPGEIPAHWQVKKLAHLLVRNEGGTWGEEDPEGVGTIVLRSTEISPDGCWQITDPARCRLESGEYRRCLLRAGDLLVTKSSGSARHIGKAALVDKEVAAMNCAFSNFMQRLRLTSGVHPKYIFYWLNSGPGRSQLRCLASASTGLKNLSGAVIAAMKVPLPPLVEQHAIVRRLDRETARIDALRAKIQAGLERLEHYRLSAIAEAVTGKTDVRTAGTAL